MTLNSSGPISLGGTTAGVSIEKELGGSGTTQISLNDTNVRTLAGVASGAITMPTNFYGKSSTTYYIGVVATAKTGDHNNQTYGMVIDSSGNLFVGGEYGNGGYGQLAIYKFTASTGAYISTFGYGGNSSSFWNTCGATNQLSICGTNIYVAAAARNSAAQNRIQGLTFTTSGTATTPKFYFRQNYPYCGSSGNSENTSFIVKKPNGNLLIGSILYSCTPACCCSVDSHFFPGVVDYNTSSSTASWALYYSTPGGANYYPYPTGATVDSSNNTYFSTNNIIGFSNWGLAKFTNTGSISWSKAYSYNSTIGSSCANPSVSSSGTYLYLGLAAGSVMSINSSSGAVNWCKSLLINGYSSSAIAQDSSGNVYFATGKDGVISGTNSNYLYIGKINSSGTVQWINQLRPTGSTLGGVQHYFYNPGTFGPYIKLDSNYLYLSVTTNFTDGSANNYRPLIYMALPLDGSHTSASTITVTAGSASYSFTYESSSVSMSSISITVSNTPGSWSSSGTGSSSTPTYGGVNTGTLETGVQTI